ncbi:sigma-70 family RNA polymerase sigma factor [Sphingopyxis sp. SE2]|uniref:sigma-70 family RNA polymerase sigma factor n=1 Tax=Sphingopyxis sp. SE2 TaxID=1586240 RepID=UPI0028C03CB0|nr:sigma-70 family RNA polymerase sigma factor [Sphingopyxis sp. SE2]MDT7531234.1 sigma-70 family RNA polymerase sigma factor [Sphingopyxis sp. SE2]
MKRQEGALRLMMEQAQLGDATAYRTLLEQLSSLLRAYMRSKLTQMGRNVADAEDVVQEVLLAVHTRRDTYDPSEPFTPWLYAIARYKLIDHLRRRKMDHAEGPLDAAEAMSDGFDHTAVESGIDMEKLLATIPQHSQRVIRDVKLDGRSVAEAAGREGITEAAAKVRIHRGLKAMTVAIGGRLWREDR